jgi:phage tail sheath gpL-like
MVKYARAKLADDGVQAGAGQVIMTPKLGKSEAINIFRGWETLGLVENIDQFKNDLVCVRSITDPNRLEWVLPPDLINQFRVGAATIQFLLET